MRVELHSMSHDIGDLVETPVIEQFHRMKNTPLYRFQTIGQMRNRPFKYHIRSIIEKPVLKHSRKLEFNIRLIRYGYFVSRMRLR